MSNAGSSVPEITCDDDTPDANRIGKNGVYRLWLAVFISAFFALKNDDEHKPGARAFFFNDNPFFDYVADGLGYEPAALRERVRDALKKKPETI